MVNTIRLPSGLTKMANTTTIRTDEMVNKTIIKTDRNGQYDYHQDQRNSQ